MHSDVDPLVEAVVARLRTRNESLSCAESCTGGLLSAMLAALPGVSDVYMGSIVAYSNQVKEDLLGVPGPLIHSVGAVSLPVARAMAHGVRETLDTSWSVSITGVAGPGGGTPDKPVGTVCFGISGPGIEFAEQHHFEGSRREVQSASALHALRMLVEQLGLDE